MRQRGAITLYADRHTAYREAIRFGMDLADAGMRMQVRTFPEAQGGALISLAKVTGENAQGLRLVEVVGTEDAPSSLVAVQIDKGTMEGLPTQRPIGADMLLYWDLLFTLPNLPELKFLSGQMIVRAGETR